MNSQNKWRLIAVAAIALVAPIAAACSAADDAGSSEDDDTGDSALAIEFPEMYSAFSPGGDHEFKIPAKVDGVKNIKWSASPSDAVTLEKQSDGSVMITTKKAGDVTITAKAGNLKATAPLHIAATTDDVWTAGSERYNNGVTFKKPDHADGGTYQRGDGGGMGERHIDPTLSCTNCHAKGGKGQDIEHTPMQTGGYSDQDLINIFTKATKPDGVPMRVTTLEQWQKYHKWQMDSDEETGIITYLRSLEPKSQGVVDFGGGVLGGHGGGKGSGSKKSSSGSDGGSVN